jgi:hypothetical protein
LRRFNDRFPDSFAVKSGDRTWAVSSQSFDGRSFTTRLNHSGSPEADVEIKRSDHPQTRNSTLQFGALQGG